MDFSTPASPLPGGPDDAVVVDMGGNGSINLARLAGMGPAPSPDQAEHDTIDRELEEKLRAMGYMK